LAETGPGPAADNIDMKLGSLMILRVMFHPAWPDRQFQPGIGQE
jgi:hypothetical protein